MSIQIYILGILAEEKSYPYMLKKRLSEPIPIDKFTGITESKLYYHFDKLAANGFIEPVETIKEENRPDKHVYQITEKGRTELIERVYQTFEKASHITDMYIALTNIKHVESEKVIEILERKMEEHRLAWETYSSFDQPIDVDPDRYMGYTFMKEHSYSRAEHTAEWLQELVSRLKENAKGHSPN
ncbi:PadR family transcriptional regulator [Peribacillus sp. SI8-4]|uniref:PadR family transcriptional regulator n=1 Tax=Peribacillus sp. SI8-4 TaxID=3048009 RepID=UPI0025543A79|nr:PadR family transcriptional regulator [Peribacillus sp. SI8-4]